MTGFPHLDQAALDDATNVLLVAPEVGQSVESLFAELLVSLESPPDHVVGVTMSKSPWDFLEPWRRSFPRGSTSFSFVSTDGISRSVAAADTTDDAGTGSDVTHVDDVLPVEAFGQTVADEVADHGAGTAMCFYSLTDLLEYVDVETAFDFLHVVLSRVRRNGARGVYHVDADVHDPATLVKLSTLFDLVVQFDRNRPPGGSGTPTGGPT
ncbi:hypothetical protein OB920_17445 [Halobacteria archaeon HArc-gm2]|nr:hypothetical protein [Halobacteria archaeon HArc-gm2]